MANFGQVGNLPESGQELKRMRIVDDTMTRIELDGDLRKITLSRKKDQKDLLAEILAVEIKYGIKIGGVK